MILFVSDCVNEESMMQSSLCMNFRRLLNHTLCLQNYRSLSSVITSQGCQYKNFLQINATENPCYRCMNKLHLGRRSALLSGFQTGRNDHWNIKLWIDGPAGRKVWVRFFSTPEKEAEGDRKRGKSVLIYASAVAVFMVGMTYAGVPLYRIFCQVILLFYRS